CIVAVDLPGRGGAGRAGMGDEIIKEFLLECQEGINQVERDLLALEENPGAIEALPAIFRAVHSIKGSSGFPGLTRLGAVTPEGETLLSNPRDGSLAVRPDIIDGLLALCDAIRSMMASIEATGTDGDRDDSALIATLRRLQEPPGPAPAPAKPAPATSAA